MSDNNIAFVFPGQGSQSIGMLAELAEAFPIVEQTFAEASEALDKDLWQLVSQGEAEALGQTQNTQPAMLAAGVAVWRVWCQQSTVRPSWMAGHSLGEYTALVCSGAISFSDAVALVAERGRLMQQAVPEGVGAMAAILGLDDEQVIAVCAESAQGEIVSAVNFNSVGQVVIAGHLAAVERAMDAAKAQGAKRAIKLPVSVPSHCALMESAAELLFERLQTIELLKPGIPVIHNVDVASHDSADAIRNILKQQLFQPVRWVDTIQAIHNLGANHFIECGPGKVLFSLNKRIVKSAKHLTIFDSNTLAKAVEQLNG